jgi:outer membrane protein
MNNRINKNSLFPALILLLFFNNIILGQGSVTPGVKSDADSLSLKSIIEQIINSHPSVKVAEEAINNANARIGLARTAYYPEADMTVNYSNMGPVTKLTIPDMGTFQLFPENNYSASINYRQLIYDFGRTRQNIVLENENKVIGERAIEQVKQRLSLLAVNNFYSLVFIQAAIKIKEKQIETLNEHLSQIEKMMATGSATDTRFLPLKSKFQP